MTAIKKYSLLLVIILIIAVMVLRLFTVKKLRDEELRAQQEYSLVVPVEITVPKIPDKKQLIEENGVLRSGSEIDVLSETSGKVLLVKGNVGEHVTAGQILVEVEKDVLESQFNLAKVSLENAGKDLARYSKLAGGEAITEQQLETVKLNHQNALANFITIDKQLQNTIIRSPVSGVIAKRSIEKGAVLMPSVNIFSILEESKMGFIIKIAENEIGLINKGQKVQVKLDAIGGRTFIGSVKSIGVVSDLSGRYEVEISFSCQGLVLRVGMTGKALYEAPLQSNGVIIPRKCITGSIRYAMVYVLIGDTVTLKSIEAIALNETEVLVTAGLSANDKIVLSGQMNLENGSKVKVLNRI